MTGSGWAGRVRGWVSDPLSGTAVVLFLLALGFAAWSGFSWLSAASAGTPASSRLRDQVLQAGEQAILNFNTLDYRKVDQGLRLWEQSSTGPLHSQIEAGRTRFAQQIQRAKAVTTAKILDGALTSLDGHAGTASIIAAIQITVAPAHGPPAVKQERLAGRLSRTADGWKLSALGPVPVGPAANPAKSPAG